MDEPKKGAVERENVAAVTRTVLERTVRTPSLMERTLPEPHPDPWTHTHSVHTHTLTAGLNRYTCFSKSDIQQIQINLCNLLNSPS